MAGTLTIPLTTLQPGTRTFGPTNLADSDTTVSLSIDRTVAGGFNSLTAATQTTISIEQSNDGGSTWQELAFTVMIGGVHVMHGGLQENTDDVNVDLLPGTGRLGRAVVVVTGTAVAVAGSLVIA